MVNAWPVSQDDNSRFKLFGRERGLPRPTANTSSTASTSMVDAGQILAILPSLNKERASFRSTRTFAAFSPLVAGMWLEFISPA